MKLIDALRIAIRIFLTNRVRSSLTVLGIAIGIGAIVFLVSLGYGLQRVTIGRITSLQALTALDVKTTSTGPKVIDKEIIAKIRQLPDVAAAGPVVTLSGRLTYNSRTADVAIWGVESNFFDLEGRVVSAGQPFVGKNSPSVVVNTVALSFFNLTPGSAIGKAVEIEYFPPDGAGVSELKRLPGKFTISGVLPDLDASAIYVPIGEFGDLNQFDSVKVQATSKETVDQVRDAIHGLGLSTESVIERVDQLDRAFGYVRLALGLLGLIALLVASIGMLNTMTISLLERIREIGIMKALGAADVDIWKLFLVESGLLGLAGSLLGLLLGNAAGRLVNTLINQLAVKFGGQPTGLFDTPFYFGVGVVVFGFVLGVLTGIFPAYRAGKLNPLDALRYE